MISVFYVTLLALAGDHTRLAANDAILIRLLLVRPGLTVDEVESSLRLKNWPSLSDGTLHQWTMTYSFGRDRTLTLWYRFDDAGKMLLQNATVRHGQDVMLQVPGGKPVPTKPMMQFRPKEKRNRSEHL
jgi:hypothetical protein